MLLVAKLGFELKTAPFSPLSASSLCWAAGAVKQKTGMFVLVLTRTQPANIRPGRAWTCAWLGLWSLSRAGSA